MSLEKLIANIPQRSDAERKLMRERALAGLQSGKPALVDNAKKVLKALEDAAIDQANARSQLIASVADASLTQRIVTAFGVDKPTATEERVIQVLLDNPDSNCAELSFKIGWAPTTWDMHFGALCKKRSSFLCPLAGTPREGHSSNLALLTIQSRGEDGAIRYMMKPEAIKAFKQLGFRA